MIRLEKVAEAKAKVAVLDHAPRLEALKLNLALEKLIDQAESEKDIAFMYKVMKQRKAE